jgi:Na+/H+ antiporter NhaD/arsenite permease-like protein
MILQNWSGIPQGTLVGLAILSTLAGNLLLIGSLANLIVAERAATSGVRLTFRDHARAGVPINAALDAVRVCVAVCSRTHASVKPSRARLLSILMGLPVTGCS